MVSQRVESVPGRAARTPRRSCQLRRNNQWPRAEQMRTPMSARRSRTGIVRVKRLEPSIEVLPAGRKAKSLPLFQQFSRGHSPRGDVVHPLSAVATASRRSLVRAWYRYLSRDCTVLVEPLHALRRSVKYLRPGQRDISVAVNPCVVVPRDTLIHHRACAAASSNAGCVST